MAGLLWSEEMMGNNGGRSEGDNEMGTAAFFVGWLFFVSAGEQKGEGEAVKICGFGEQSGCSGIKKSKAKVGARLVLASGEEDSGRKIQTSRWGADVCKEIGLGLGFVFFCIFLMFQNYPLL